MGEAWRALVEQAAGRPDGGLAEPHWTAGGVPWCDEKCRYHDGKRCELLGLRAPHTCEPVVAEMARLLNKGEASDG